MADAKTHTKSVTDVLGKCHGSLSDDILRGAEAIAEFMLGDPKKRRQVYHLAQMKRLPVFRLGSTLCARRSTLIAWIEDQETNAMKTQG